MSVPTVLIPKATESLDAPTFFPQWWPVQGDLPIYSCGGCGQLLALHPDHRIDADGNVTASMWHSPAKGGCDWHVFARLLDWDPKDG